eukprot:m.434822 g.434822  ORF g.434822 m.434822 type:complete len:99 (-) comp56760_c0_seq13:1442-1738(-)
MTAADLSNLNLSGISVQKKQDHLTKAHLTKAHSTVMSVASLVLKQAGLARKAFATFGARKRFAAVVLRSMRNQPIRAAKIPSANVTGVAAQALGNRSI